MVLIITDERDEGTIGVIEWLNYYKVPFIRLNQEDAIKNIEIDFEKEDVLIETTSKKKIAISEVDVCWYRKGDIRLFLEKTEPEYLPYLENEWNVIVDYIVYKIEEKSCLGSYRKEGENNKLKNLCIAKSLGLKIPSSAITSSRKSLSEFFEEKKRIITKSMHHDFSLTQEGKLKRTRGTVLVKEEMINKMNPRFFPSFVQGYVEKKYELRIFFLEGKCYTICIFSQMAEETKVDQRNYNFNKMNRMVPYQLPKAISEKIKALMNQLELNTGSLDFIVTNNQDYVFLEVNPIGQFAWVSKAGNYQLEKRIATALMQKCSMNKN